MTQTTVELGGKYNTADSTFPHTFCTFKKRRKVNTCLGHNTRSWQRRYWNPPFQTCWPSHPGFSEVRMRSRLSNTNNVLHFITHKNASPVEIISTPSQQISLYLPCQLSKEGFLQCLHGKNSDSS